MPNNLNNKKITNCNFAASHDQASIQGASASKFKELEKVRSDLKEQKISLLNFKLKSSEEQQKLLNSEEQQKLLKEFDAKKIEIINLVKYARQLVADIHESAKKLNAIQQLSSEEKLENANSLLPSDKRLNEDEKYRFDKIERALSNTCIIKSAGDETIKFQLGVIGNAREANVITESEFKHLTVIRLKENNLLDGYRLFKEGGIIYERSPLEICQAINKKLSIDPDPDYKESKTRFFQRLEGICHELEKEKRKQIADRFERGEEIDLAAMWRKLEQHEGNTSDNLEEVDLKLPEVGNTSLEDTREESSSEAEIINSSDLRPTSEFVELIEELVPENKRNELQIDMIKPIAVEKIMKITLERPSPISDDKKRNINHSFIMRAEEITSKAFYNIKKDIKDSFLGIDSSRDYHYATMMSDLSKLKEDYAKETQETKPCKLVDKKLVSEYYRFGEQYLVRKKQKIENELKNLKSNKKNKTGNFRKNYLKSQCVEARFDPKKEREKVYQKIKTDLVEQLKKTEKQKALWTFTRDVQEVYYKEKRKISLSEKEVEFRNHILNYDLNSEKKIIIDRHGVYLLNVKEERVISNESALSINPSVSKAGLSSARAPHKNLLITEASTSSSSFFATAIKANESDEKKSAAQQRIIYKLV